jgi:hypothetical protein
VAHSASGFTYHVRGADVVIHHGSRRASTLRGTAARQFLVDIATGDPQQLMARVTGNYKRGNERDARTTRATTANTGHQLY